MERLEVSGAVRLLKWPLGVKWLKVKETVDWVLVMGNTEMHVTRKSDDLS
jgi:hypothetical protein